jgi:transcriptional regulator with PAS, ATPase and Fis domain
VIPIHKKILLLTKSEEAFQLIQKQLEDLFPHSVLIVKYASEVDFEEFDLLIATYPYKGLKVFPSEKTIIVKRTIHVSFIEKLLQLPRATTCYVASNTYEASIESIEMLQNFGIQLNMLPYPRSESELNTEISTVITHHLHLIPSNKFSKVIEIGIRPLDFTTIVDIAVRLQLNIHTHSVFKATNMDEIVRLNLSLSESNRLLKNVYQQVDAIINTSQDGIITLNSQNTIIQVNKALLGVLTGHNTKSIIGRSFSDVFPSFELFPNRDDYLYTLNEVQFVVQQLPITLNDGEIGTLIVFREINKLQQTEQEVRRKIHAHGFVSKYQFSQIIGDSQILQETIDKARRLGASEQPILILGENGTGKELFAHSLHHISKRKNYPFVPINFAGLPESLAESELFGYEDGAFTGAKKGGKPGFFELAHNGTIFLDEIGDAPPSIQAALLRVLQEKQILRVGGIQLIPVNVRIIAATNKDLVQLVEQGKFREDLFYRLNVLPLHIPSLRERREDIIPLLEYFFSKQLLKPIRLEDKVKNQLLAYSWPGNIRELENTVYYLSAIIKEDVIHVADLPNKFLETGHADESILNQLETEGSLSEFTTILTYLYSAKQNNWHTGRTAMEAYFKKEKVIPLSSQQIKSRMSILKKYNLIEIGSTRQGSWITQLGIRVLETIRLN